MSAARPAALLLMTASGFAGLGYQIVWTQQSALWLGHESAAVLAVITAFFGGLALGALAMGPRIENSSQPLHWYAGCEAVIALWSLLLTLLMQPFSQWMLALTGVQPLPVWQWTVAFTGTFFLLLPATAAMGATLPAMERVTAQLRSAGRSIAVLYAANTLGAVLGVLTTAFYLAPVLGLTTTAIICIGLNLLCAVAALIWLPASSTCVSPTLTTKSTIPQDALLRLTCTGLLGIGYEVLVVRVLSQVDEDTVYTFAMLLAVYLIGTALGAAVYQRSLASRIAKEKLSDQLLSALSTACLLGAASLWGAELIKAQLLLFLGPGMLAAIAAEALLAVAAFGLPTFIMGGLFSHLSACACASGCSFGRALGVNTLGAALAPLLFGVVLTPILGPKFVLLLIACGYLILTSKTSWFKAPVLILTSVLLAIAILTPPLTFVSIPEEGRLISYQEGVMAAVSVVADADNVARLRINNRQQEGDSNSLLVDGRQALLPLLLHPAPQRALFLGLGTGVTSSTAAEDPSLQVDAVELLPEVIAASDYFRQLVATEHPNPRLHLLAADARRYILSTPLQYDVIIADNFHPARSGSGALYTVEHFRAVQERLTSNGLFCQWLPLHQLDLQTLRSIVRSFTIAYPNAWALLASNSLETPVLGLVGRKADQRFDVAEIRQRLAAARPKPPSAFGIDDEFALLGSFIAGPQALANFAGNSPANTDDHPVVAYLAPRATYAPESLPRDRLLALLPELSIAPTELVAAENDPSDANRLAAYWTARNRFIAIGKNVRPSNNVQYMLAQVQEPLLAVLRLSPDFRPAYDPLLRMASVLGRSDKQAAGLLLQELTQIQPARIEAEQALKEIGQLNN